LVASRRLFLRGLPPSGLPEWPTWLLAALAPAPEPSPKKALPAKPIAALRGALATIARAREGERNSLLFWGACRMLEAIAAGLVTRPLAEQLLLEAASQAGLFKFEAMRTIRSAFAARRAA
jgi:hypothetical protein